MTRIPAAGATQASSGLSSQGNSLKDLDLDQFLKLLIVEMQNQDPLNPMDNSEILQQISQIRTIGATDQLSETLQSVLTGQNLSTASGLIGKQVTALTDLGKNVTGIVDRVSVEVNPEDNTDRTLKVHIGNQSVDLNNIREILEQESEGSV